MNQRTLRQENEEFEGTAGVSANNVQAGFVPAFRDEATGRIEVARMPDGAPAPMHLMTWLPSEWGKTFHASGGIAELKDGIVCGFSRDGEFYTREETARLLG